MAAGSAAFCDACAATHKKIAATAPMPIRLKVQARFCIAASRLAASARCYRTIAIM
jgi:hypothetical protein